MPAWPSAYRISVAAPGASRARRGSPRVPGRRQRAGRRCGSTADAALRLVARCGVAAFALGAVSTFTWPILPPTTLGREAGTHGQEARPSSQSTSAPTRRSTSRWSASPCPPSRAAVTTRRRAPSVWPAAGPWWVGGPRRWPRARSCPLGSLPDASAPRRPCHRTSGRLPLLEPGFEARRASALTGRHPRLTLIPPMATRVRRPSPVARPAATERAVPTSSDFERLGLFYRGRPDDRERDSRAPACSRTTPRTS